MLFRSTANGTMDREVDWTDPAWDDLADIAAYIARDSEYYAAAFVQEIKEAAASLAEFAATRGEKMRSPWPLFSCIVRGGVLWLKWPKAST